MSAPPSGLSSAADRMRGRVLTIDAFGQGDAPALRAPLMATMGVGALLMAAAPAVFAAGIATALGPRRAAADAAPPPAVDWSGRLLRPTVDWVGPLSALLRRRARAEAGRTSGD